MGSKIVMPKLGLTMDYGTITEWLVKEGDSVKKDDEVFNLETEKVVFTYQAPADFELIQILVQPGVEVPVGEAVALVEGEGFEEAAAESSAAEAPLEDDQKTDAAAVEAAPAPVPANTVATQSAGGRIKSSPRARKIAQVEGVSLDGIVGSGPGGRIIGDDVLAVVAANEQVAVAPQPAATPVVAAESVTEIIPSQMRQTIQRRLTEAWKSPHIYLQAKFDATQVLDLKNRFSVSINTLVVYATIRALIKHPNININFTNNTIYQYANVNIGVAVGMDNGLVVGVVKDSQAMDVRALHERLGDLFGRIKAGTHEIDDITGGTFTVTNLGMYGIDQFTAITNPPEGGILSVGQINEVLEKRDDEIVAVPYINLVGGFDHNVIDGVQGAQFLQTLTGFLEDPLMML